MCRQWRKDSAEERIRGKSLSNQSWIVGAKLAYGIYKYSLLVSRDHARANASNDTFRALIADFANGNDYLDVHGL